MKDVLIGMFYAFLAWLGFIIFGIISFSNILPDKWYIVIPLFFLSIAWTVIVRNWTEKRRK